MKNIFLILFIICISSSLCYAQNDSLILNLDVNNNSSNIIIHNSALDNNTKFLKAKDWISKIYGNYKDIVQLEDKDNCKIILNGITEMEHTNEYSNTEEIPFFHYILTMEFKNDKYRLIFDNIHIRELRVVDNGILGRNSESSYKSLKDVILPDTRKLEKLLFCYKDTLGAIKNIDIEDLNKKRRKTRVIKIAELERKIEGIEYSIKLLIDRSIVYKRNIHNSIINICKSLDKEMSSIDEW